MVSPLSPVTASKLSFGSHLVGASGLGFIFLGLGLGPVIDPNVTALVSQQLLTATKTLQFPTVEVLNAFDVVFGEQEACAVGVGGVHEGTGVCGVTHPQGVSQLVRCHYEQVVSCRKSAVKISLGKKSPRKFLRPE